MDDADDSSSEQNITLNGIVNFQQSIYVHNRKAYSITMTKTASSNNYDSKMMGFNLYPLGSTKLTAVIAFYPPEMTNINVLAEASTATIIKQSIKDFDTYAMLYVQVDNSSLQTPDYLY